MTGMYCFEKAHFFSGKTQIRLHFRCPSNLEETHLEMLNLWLDPDDVIQDADGDNNEALPRPKRTVSDHFREAIQ